MSSSKTPQVHGIFDPATWTVTYVVYEKVGSACAIIDSVLDYDPKSGRTHTTSADKVIAFSRSQSSKMSTGACPPNSIVVRFTPSAASLSKCLPTGMEPVKLTLRMMGEAIRWRLTMSGTP